MLCKISARYAQRFGGHFITSLVGHYQPPLTPPCTAQYKKMYKGASAVRGLSDATFRFPKIWLKNRPHQSYSSALEYISALNLAKSKERETTLRTSHI